MPTFTIDSGGSGATSEPVALAFPTTAVPTPAGEPTYIDIIAVDDTGLQYASYPEAVLGDTVEVLNMWEEATFTIPLDTDVTELPLPNEDATRAIEVQIWRNGHLLFWGIPTDRRADSSSRTWRYTARGFLWVLNRRFIGKASRTDLLSAAPSGPEHLGNFEEDALAWWDVQDEGSGDLVATADTTIKLLDDQSAKLVAPFAGNDYWIGYRKIITGTAIGTAIFATAWIYVENLVEARGDSMGLWLGVAADPADLTPDGGGADEGTYRFAFARYDAGTPVNGWTRLGAVVHVLPNATETVEIRLFAPGEGTVYWDAVTLTALESLSMIAANSPPGGWDQVQIAHEIVKDLQGVSGFSTTLGEHNGKSNLNIAVSGALSGIIKERTYQHADHPKGYGGGAGVGALDEFSTASDGFDYRIDLTPTTRTFRTYHPSVGTDYSDLQLRWIREITDDGDINFEQYGIVSWTYGESIVTAANDIVELGGWGSGAGREEGAYRNPSSLGGLTLELVEGAPNGTPIDLLDAVAEQRGSQLETPITVPDFILAEPRDPLTQEVTYPLIGVIRPGDRIPFLVREGSLQMDGTYRIARVRYDARTETLIVTPNPQPLTGS